jgi:hypothetical protein
MLKYRGLVAGRATMGYRYTAKKPCNGGSAVLGPMPISEGGFYLQ